MKRGIRGVVLVLEIECLLVANGERHVAEDELIAGYLALDMSRDGLSIPLMAQDAADTHRGFDAAPRDLDQKIGTVGAVSGAGDISHIRANDWELVRAVGRRAR